jgi:hypothetical protein
MIQRLTRVVKVESNDEAGAVVVIVDDESSAHLPSEKVSGCSMADWMALSC